MDGRTLVRALAAGTALPRPPYAPLVGDLACVMGQVPADRFAGDPQVQATVLAQAGAALSADVIAVGVLGSAAVGVETIPRLRAARPDVAVAGWVAAGDVLGTRAYCEAGADLLFVTLGRDGDGDGAGAGNGGGGPSRGTPPSPRGKLRTQGNAAAFYSVPTILVAPGGDASATAQATGLSGAVVTRPRGDEPGIIGGDLPADAAPNDLVPPRPHSFFWTFAAPAGADADVDALAALGRRLTAAAVAGS